MIYSIELTPEMEDRLRAGVAQHDSGQVRDVLTTAVESLVVSIMQDPHTVLVNAEWDRMADELVAFVDSLLPVETTVLSDYALSREGIYGEHP